MSQVTNWHPDQLTAVAASLAQLSGKFDDANNAVSKSTDTALAHWEGDAATAADARLLAGNIAANHISAAVLAHVDAINDAAGGLEPVARSATETTTNARNAGFKVNEDGTVEAPEVHGDDAATVTAMQSQLNEQAKAWESKLIPLLDSAGELDAKAAQAVTTATAQLDKLVRSPSTATVLSPQVLDILGGRPLPDDPKALADFWSHLTPAEKDALYDHDPSIGNRNGLPAEDKNHYNELYMDKLEQDAERTIAANSNGHPDWAKGENIPKRPDAGLPDEDTQARIREYEKWKEQWHNSGGEKAAADLKSYNAIREQLDKGETPKYLLNVDDHGRGAIALNNPDTADNVATYVPGMDTKLENIGGGLERSQRMIDAAMKSDPSETTSVVAWYDYNAPQGLTQAAQDRFADEGAPRLDAFQDGLRASHDGQPSTNTIVAHSYGSFLTGTAATDGSLAVDNIVVAGSPGIAAHNVGELHLDGIPASDNSKHFYATAASNDPVAALGNINEEFLDIGHGPNPAAGGFGGTTFDSKPGSLTGAHSEYWDLDNPALWNMGNIITGRGVQ